MHALIADSLLIRRPLTPSPSPHLARPGHSAWTGLTHLHRVPTPLENLENSWNF